VQGGSAFPGDESLHYDQNPGEAWAETYRLLEERKASIFTATWQIVSPSFFPNDAAYAAAERDVLQPWTASQATTYRTQFTKKGKKVWVVHLQPALDGNINVKASLPKGGLYDVALLGANRRTVLKHGVSSGARVERLAAGVCGQRSLFLQVTDKATAKVKAGTGRVAVTVSTP
jgi:hypothetical protein